MVSQLKVVVACALIACSYAGSGQPRPFSDKSWNVPLAQPQYQSQSASAKLSTLMGKLQATKGSSGSYPGGAGLLGIFSDHTSTETSLSFESDEMPEGRVKYIHSVGAVAQVKFESSGKHPYTGIFSGADTGIVRLSSALNQDPKSKYDPSATNGGSLAPGFGLKFLRDGIKSCNLVAMYSVDGQSSHNFFKYTHTTQIGNSKGLPQNVLAQKFATAQSSKGWVAKVGISGFATAGQDGKSVTQPKAPFYLEFKPTSETANLFPDDYDGTYFADQLATIKSGTALWEVRAIAEPGAAAVTIGSLVTTSDMFKSSWGDEHLFFQHQAWPEDTDLHPEWLNQQSKWNDNFVNAFAGSPLQTEPVVASIFASPKYNAAFKTASAVAGLAKPNLPYTMLETRDALQHRSRCPFASKLVEQHNNHQKELAQSLERNLAKCSTKFAPVKEDAWQENGGV